MVITPPDIISMSGTPVQENRKTDPDPHTPSFIETIFEPDQVIEVRVIRTGGNIQSGFYTDRQKLLHDVNALDSDSTIKGIYVVLNKIDPEILKSRSPEQINNIARGKATSVENITRRKWLVLDYDPIKATTESDSSSTEEEKREAFNRAQRCEEYLSALGFPEPVRGDSGNGAHRIYPIDLPNDQASYDLISKVLSVLNVKFGVDVTMKDAPRISKLYGTTARKGANTPERPWRKSRLLSAPATIIPVTVEQLQSIANIGNVPVTVKKEPVSTIPDDPITGPRHPELVRLVTSMEAQGFSYPTIYADCVTLNLRFSPPKTADVLKKEVQAIFNWAHKNSTDKIKNPDGTSRMRINAGHSTGEFPKIKDALTAIVNYHNKPNPRVFVRGGKLSRIILDEKGTPKIGVMDKDSLSVVLTQCIDWFRFVEVVDEKDPKKKSTVEKLTVTPAMVISRLMGLGEWEGIPPLEGIVESPYITDDGEIVTTPGYNPKTRLFFAPSPGLKKIEVPTNPTKEEVASAKELLFNLFDEFVFEEEASRENHIACLITSAIRPIIHGVTPLAVYDKPVMGAGASLLGDIISRITTGRPAAMIHAPTKKTEEEWNKLIVSLLREGRSLNIFDNVEGDIYTSSLAMLLTSPTYCSRILSTMDTGEYPNNAVWVVNGNNILITHDLPRRCFWIRLATNVARPYERTNWKIPNIREYALEHRAEYLMAILIIVRAWHVDGRKRQRDGCPVLGGYEEWLKNVGGVMAFIKCENFLANTVENIENSEEMLGDVETFLEELFEAFKSPGKGDILPPPEKEKRTRKFTVKDIEPIGDKFNYIPDKGKVVIEKMPGYMQDLHSKEPKKLPHLIGQFLRKHNGRVFMSGYKIVKVGIEPHANTMQYRIVYYNPKNTDDNSEVGKDVPPS